MATTTPDINNRFTTFPTPKYLRIRNKVAARERKTPLLVFKSRVDRVKRRARKNKVKKAGKAANVKGSIKTISKIKAAHKTIITKSVGRKFFLLFLISVLFLAVTLISF